MRNKITLWLTVVTLIFTLNACTATRLAYNNASVVLNYYLDDFVDLSSAQKAWLSPRWIKLVEWHRENELPIYKKLLLQSKEQLNGQITAAEVNAVSGEIKASFIRAVDFLMPDITEFVAQLTPAQIDYLERKLAKDNTKRAKEITRTIDDRKKRKLEKYLENFEENFGKASDEQRAKITEVVSSWPLLDEARQEQSLRGQAAFLKLLREHSKDPAVISATLKARITKPETNRTPTYQTLIAEEEKQNIALNVWLVNNASPKQKAKLAAQLEGYAQDVTGLLKR